MTRKRIFDFVLTWEGGWRKKPNEEAYAGIDRRWHPDWPGWAILDRVGSDPLVKRAALEAVRPQLAPLVQDFYNKLFAESAASRLRPPLDFAFFDTAVNQGEDTAAVHLQEALNLIGQNGKRWPVLKMDGKIGPRTGDILTQAHESGFDVSLVQLFLDIRISRYIDLARANPSKYIDDLGGWLRRTYALLDEVEHPDAYEA